MPERKERLHTGGVYHVFTRSIAKYRIFNTCFDFARMIETIQYYKRHAPLVKFSRYLRKTCQGGLVDSTALIPREKDLVSIVAYCIMPTHIHLVLRQMRENGILRFMHRVLDSYSRYYNLKYHRKGPLWEGRFKNIPVTDTTQLLHLTRYIHVNPVTADLTDTPDEWLHSSYHEYLSNRIPGNRLCNFDELLTIEPAAYKAFVDDKLSFREELGLIARLVLE